MDIFYFDIHYVYEESPYEEREQHGFVVAEDFTEAMKRIAEYFGNDLISVEITVIGDTSLISVEDKEIAETFKKAYLKTHYGEE